MALKKSQLHSSLWSSCDELRGGMDASQYKDYVLVLLFVKYVSDKYAGKADALIEVPVGGGFADMIALKGHKDIGDKINKIIGKLAEANGLKGVIDQADFNNGDRLGNGREMVDRLSRLVAIFQNLDFRANRAAGDDLLGDAYEYLMRHFATESGKSKGQFYTPAEVSLILAKVLGIGSLTRQDQTVYDPTCGSGSLLLKAADEAPRSISIYGQEIDNATWAMARMNMILHSHPTAVLEPGNTLAAPVFRKSDGSLQTFDFAVANPPFSSKAWSNGVKTGSDEFKRFEYGVPPLKNGDYAFLLHILKSLKSAGKAAVILPHGVLFRGNKEADIRRNLITRGLIKGIIGLPANLFYGTSIPACVMVIDKENAVARTGIFMIDASRGFIKDGNKNRLRAQDIHKVVDTFNRQKEISGYSRFVPVSEISRTDNDYNLNIARYIDSSEPVDIEDLDGHLRGGVPDRDIEALRGFWDVLPDLRAKLFMPADRPGFSRANVRSNAVDQVISGHPQFEAFANRLAEITDQWRTAHEAALLQLTRGSKPKELISILSDDLLARIGTLPLLDKYDVFQRLMDYWAEVMQDDVYLIASEGWQEGARPRPVIEDRERKIKETPDLVLAGVKYKMDLLPPNLLVARFFGVENAHIESLALAQAAAEAELTEFVDEHAVDEGLLADARTEKGSVTLLSATQRSIALRSEPESDDEREVVDRCIVLLKAGASASKTLKDARDELARKVLACYGSLRIDEIRSIVVHDKWLETITESLNAEAQELGSRLSNRVRELDERYATPLPQLRTETRQLTEAVDRHLRAMGMTWP